MKIILVLLTTISSAVAATLTVDIPANDVPRVSKAFGQLYQLGHDANMNEVSFYTRMWIIDRTKQAEQATYSRNYVEQPMDMQPTPTPTPTGTPGMMLKVNPTPTSTPKK
jgi:hypothetical protein